MNRHDKRREIAINRRKQKAEKKLAQRIGRMGEQLARQWVTEFIEKAQKEQQS